jgi:hypothetical protein
MRSGITFPENTVGTQETDLPRIFKAVKMPFHGLRKFIEESDWDERLLGYEKYINRVCWAVIIASVIYLTPVCIAIFIR